MPGDGRLFWVRARWLLERLRAGAKVTAPLLAEQFEISVPTAHRVINALRDDFDAPMRFDGRLGSWVLDDATFDLPRLPLSAEEVGAVALARALFERVSAPPLARAIESFWRKLEGELLARSPAGVALTRSLDAALPSLSKVPASTLDTVLRALALRRCLHLVYRSPWTDERTVRDVEPYRLVLYDGTYYLIGHCRLRNALRSFNLAAATGVSLLPIAAPEPNERELERYLASGWGAFRGGRTAVAVLRITPPASRLLATQLWHRDQHDQVSRDGTLTRRIPIAGLPELVGKVLSLGAAATVVEPPELASAVAAEVRKMAARLPAASRPSATASQRGRRRVPEARASGFKRITRG